MNEFIVNWDEEKIPSFDGLSCYVLPGAFHGTVVMMMAEAKFSKAFSIEDADIVVFTGGSDVSPSLYSQKALDTTESNLERDNYELTVFEDCVKRKKPMFGICRGAQFLHVANGGKLWQHVNNHANGPHFILDIDEDMRIMSSSMHHQMIMNSKETEEKLSILALTEDQVATEFKDDHFHISLSKDRSNTFYEEEIEAGAYKDTTCFFVQGHPEVGPPQYKSWVMHKLHDFLFDTDFLAPINLTSSLKKTMEVLG